MGVNLEYDIFGQKVITCFMCGNRYPGGREGFYMSDKAEGQIRKENKGITGDKQEDAKPVKLCATCHTKPTISAGSNICASCMAKKANEKMRLDKMAGNKEKPEKTKGR
jgi:hypothetical protein